MADQTQLDRMEALLATIKLQNTQQTALLSALFSGEQLMSAQLDALKDQVTQSTTVEQSAITLITGIASQLAQVSAQLAAAGADTAALDGIRTNLQTSAAALAAAVTANTPSAPPT
jgi:hypothetical protein